MSTETTNDKPHKDSGKLVHSDPVRYFDMCKPHENDEASKAFYDEVSAARVKHRMPDVLVVVSFNVNYDDGVGAALNCFSFGDSRNTESLAAFALGQQQADRREHINKLVANVGKTVRGKRPAGT